MDYCINCGAELPESSDTCPECGAERFGRRPSTIPGIAGKPVSSPGRPIDSFEPTPASTGLGMQADPFALPQSPSQSRQTGQADLSSMPSIGSSEPSAPAESDFSLEELTAFNPNEAVNVKSFTDTNIEYEDSEIEVDQRVAVLSTGGFIGSFILMGIPIIGWLACLIWALGGCKNRNRRNLARSLIIMFLISVAISSAAALVAMEFFEPTVNKFAQAFMGYWQDFIELTNGA